MENKFIKRIVAVAAGAVLLSTSVFAATITLDSTSGGWDATSKEIKFSYDAAALTGLSKVTYLARAAHVATDSDAADAEGYTDANSTKYVFDAIVAIDQIDSITSTGMNVSAKVSDSVLPSASTHIVLMSGDDVSAAADVKVIALAAEEPAYTYDVAVTNANYPNSNTVTSEIIRITGLDPAEVKVSIGDTVGKYYTRTTTTGSEKVIVLCVAADAGVDYTNTDAVKALITVAEGETAEMLYGDSNGTGGVTVADSTDFARKAANATVKTPGGTKAYALPTDLMELHKLDVNADGKVTVADVTMFKRSAANASVKSPSGTTVYSLPTMNCYKK